MPGHCRAERSRSTAGCSSQLKSESELAAVLGHEIVHAAARHSAQQMSRGMLVQGGLLAAQVAASDSDYGNLYMAGAGLAAQLDDAEVRSRRRTRIRPLRHGLHAARRLRPAGRRDAAGDLPAHERRTRTAAGSRDSSRAIPRRRSASTPTGATPRSSGPAARRRRGVFRRDGDDDACEARLRRLRRGAQGAQGQATRRRPGQGGSRPSSCCRGKATSTP